MEEEDPSVSVEPSWWRPARGGGRRREPLSRDAIIDAAIAILDAEGVDALTVRRLAKALDTGPATLYWHISNKDELGEQVYDRLMGEIELPEPDPTRWQEQLLKLGRQSYRLMLRHNDAVRLSLGRVPVGPNMLRIMEWSVGLLRSAGIPDQAAAYFGDMMGRYIDASVLEVTMAPKNPEGAAAIGEHFRSLPPERFPNMAALSQTMFVGTDDDRFEFGMQLLITGLAALAEPPAAGAHGGHPQRHPEDTSPDPS